ncbi:MAG: hypothetical protein JOZ81_08180 [Chloroflexi bacterium]|nr:hypothetical protein [Chloroflexota bacterium]
MAGNMVAQPHGTATTRARAAHPVRIEVWGLRAMIAAAACFALVQRQPLPALGGFAALAASFAPTLVSRGSRTAVPRLLELIWVLAATVPGVSTALMLYDHVTHWGKVVHGVQGFLGVACIALLLLGYREFRSVDLTDELVGLVSIFAGFAIGVGWEIIEFVVDWVAGASLQKSNSDTMTDLLVNNVGAVLAALLSVRVYTHWVRPDDKRDMGTIATWLVAGPSRLLDRHGHLMVFIAAAIIAAAIAILWFTGRPVPGLPAS